MHIRPRRVRSFLLQNLTYPSGCRAAGHHTRKEYGAFRLRRLQRNIQPEPRRQALDTVREPADRRLLLRMFPVQIIDLTGDPQKITAFLPDLHFLIGGDQLLPFQSREHRFLLRRVLLQNRQSLVHGRGRFLEAGLPLRRIHLPEIFILIKDMVHFQDAQALQLFKDRFTVLL